MRKPILLMIIVGALVSLLLVSVSHANPVSVGDWVKLYDGVGLNPGGSYNISHLNKDTGEFEFDFSSFCLEVNEFFIPGDPYKIKYISQSARSGGYGAGPDGDPISKETAYLYYRWDTGNIEHNADNATALQKAIWYLEQESSLKGGTLAKALISEAVGASQEMLDYAYSRVRVLTLVDANGNPAQDQLYVAPVPEPATMLLVGSGLIGFGAFTRRKYLSMRKDKK